MKIFLYTLLCLNFASLCCAQSTEDVVKACEDAARSTGQSDVDSARAMCVRAAQCAQSCMSASPDTVMACVQKCAVPDDVDSAKPKAKEEKKIHFD